MAAVACGSHAVRISEAEPAAVLKAVAQSLVRGILGLVLLSVALPGLVAFSLVAMYSDRRASR